MKNSRLFKLIQSWTKINKNRYISTIISHFFNNIVFFSLLFRVIQIIGQIIAIRIRSIMWFKNISLFFPPLNKTLIKLRMDLYRIVAVP